MLSVHDVADYFLAQMSEECGDTISPLKLQKLVYYAQGFHLAVTGDRLFAESMKHWDHGPVVPDLWHRFKHIGAGAIPKPENVDFEKFAPREREILDEVYRTFGQYSAWKLRNMTHEEDPWKNTKDGDTIEPDALRHFFKPRVVES